MESIILDLIPNGIMPVLHASQYDISRSYHIDITELGAPYKLDGTETLTINERKGDNNICTLDVENTFADKTYIEFTSTEQMCAVWGSNLCELRIIKGGVDLGTLNFILEVEASPIEGGIQSESEINNLYTQIDARVDEDVDDKLSEYATKEELAGDVETINTALDTKADKATTYTKTEVNTALDTKANASDVYDKSETYSKNEVDTLIDNLPEPMIFKGTLGVGGTIQTLPTASALNEGFTYKVITDGTYAGQTAKVGDVFTSNGSAWVLIPSGDTDTDTWRAIKVNGVEKLGNGISSGSLDVVDTDNIEAEFDNDGNKLKIKTRNIYTQSEVDTLIANAVDSVLPTDSVAKSAIATFETDLAKPIELKAYIEATQASGTPTPSTPLPISGWSEVNLYQLGGNFFNKNTVTSGKLINGSGNEVSYTDWNISDFIPVIEGASYYFYGITTHPNTNQDNFELFDENKNKVGFANVKTNEQPYLIPSGVKYIKCCLKNPDLNTAQFGVSQNTSYVPYTPTINTVTIALGDTYYGGYVEQDKDGHRQLVVTSKRKKIKDIEGWAFFSSYNYFETVLNEMRGGSTSEVLNGLMCECYTPRTTAQAGSGNVDLSIAGYSYLNQTNNLRIKDNAYNNDKDAWLAAVGDYFVVYPLAEPLIIALPDGEPLYPLIGVNNLLSDCGDVECSFKSSVAMYVDNHSGGNLLGMGGVYLGGAKSGGSEEEPDEGEDTEKVKLDEPKEEIKTIGDTKKLGGE